MARELIYRLMPSRLNRAAGPEKLAPEDARWLQFADVVGEPGRVKRCRGLARGQVTKSASTITAAGMFERQDCRKVFIDASAAGAVRITPGVIAACVGPLPDWQDEASPLDAQDPTVALPWPACGPNYLVEQAPGSQSALWFRAVWAGAPANARLTVILSPYGWSPDQSWKGVGYQDWPAVTSGNAIVTSFSDVNLGSIITGKQYEVTGYVPISGAVNPAGFNFAQAFFHGLEVVGGNVVQSYVGSLVVECVFVRDLAAPASGGAGTIYTAAETGRSGYPVQVLLMPG